MKLKDVKIRNFRSIENQTVSFDITCRILVGINESGKSNILRALSFLSDHHSPSRINDLREALPDESPIEESSVMFVFSLDKQESDKVLETVRNGILTVEQDPPIASIGDQLLTVSEYCASRNEGLYTVNVMKETKNPQYWTVTCKLLSDWKKPSSSCPPNFSIQHKEQSLTLRNYKLIRTSDFEGIPQEYLEEASISDLGQISGNCITQIVTANKPDVILWQYDEKNLLPSSINITQFCANPDSCLPLKNMFSLSGVSSIGTSIKNARARGHNQFNNYLAGIANKTTAHFRSVWEEYKDVEFSLRADGDNIIPGVKEINTLDFSKRSDGFKRFVTFLLMISVVASSWKCNS